MTGENARTPYDYSQRKGLLPISWNDFHGICKALARAIYAYRPEIILPVGRGGYYPGTLLAHMLQVDVYPVRLSRRVNDRVVYANPRWLVEPPPVVNVRRVLVVDEISSSGQTLQFVKEKVLLLGAQEVRSAVMYAHSWGTHMPDYIGLVSDALILNPWDREVLDETGFRLHPEYAQALAQQGLEAGPGLLIPATGFVLAKGGLDD
jgi:hypoxanthine phosphoribosyltransferase